MRQSHVRPVGQLEQHDVLAARVAQAAAQELGIETLALGTQAGSQSEAGSSVRIRRRTMLVRVSVMRILREVSAPSMLAAGAGAGTP